MLALASSHSTQTPRGCRKISSFSRNWSSAGGDDVARRDQAGRRVADESGVADGREASSHESSSAKLAQQ
jgi:hypothetical protein